MFHAGGQTGHGQLVHYAVRRETSDRLDVLEYLLSMGAQIDYVMYQNDPNSYHLQKAFGLGTAMHEAARLGRAEIVRFLAARGANPWIEDSLGRTPLEIAVMYSEGAVGNALRTLQLLVKPPIYQFTAAARGQDAWR